MAATERLLLVLVMIELAIEKKAVVAQANFTSGGYEIYNNNNTSDTCYFECSLISKNCKK
jgi:hypothetical protein